MIDMEQKVREKLEKEAARWVEEELERRMSYAKDAIDYQVNVSADMCGECEANKHIKEASALAEESIRQELEFEADGWIEGKLKERTKLLLEDRDLEGNIC